MNLERWLLSACLAWTVAIAIISPALVAGGYMDLMRYVLCIFFLGGASLSVVGYLRYLPGGPKAPALLILSLVKSSTFMLLGAGFLVAAIFQPNTAAVNAALLITYSFFGAAGAVKSFVGLYLFLGAKRGWISRMVYKNPFYNEGPKDDIQGGHRLDE